MANSDINQNDEERMWMTKLENVGLPAAKIVSRSEYEPMRRVYIQNGKILKVSLSKYRNSSVYRRNTLLEEGKILTHCQGIKGIPQIYDFYADDEIEILTMNVLLGVTLNQVNLNIRQSILVLTKFAFVLFQISLRGISHNDIRPRNIIVSDDYKVFLIDFDQASKSTVFEALFDNYLKRINIKMNFFGSFLTIVKYQARRVIPAQMWGFLATAFGASTIHPLRALPDIPQNTSPEVQFLHKAWQIAQVSDANAPGQRVSYYSFEMEGYLFPGERPWDDRWAVLSNITDFQDKRILEIGCNLSLLSCFLLKENNAQAALAIDVDAKIIEGAQYVSSALHVSPEYLQIDLDSTSDWENKLALFEPDVVFALSVLNWVQDKNRLLSFLGRFPEVIFEGHDSIEIETERFRRVGFQHVDLIALSERGRPILYCHKAVSEFKS